MNGQVGYGRNYIPKGSVRSLPKGKLQDLRRMFDDPIEEHSSPSHQEENLDHPKSYVHTTGAKFETHVNDESMAKNSASSSPPKWRQHISEPKNIRDSSLSPVRTHRTVNPPLPKYGNYPKPSPRKMDSKATEGTGNNDVDKSHSESTVSKLPIAKFEQLAAAVAGNDLPGKQVKKGIGQFEANRDHIDSASSANLHPSSNPKIPLKPRNPSPRRKSPSPANGRGQSPVKKSPLLARKFEQEKPEIQDDEQNYGCLWKGKGDVSKLQVANNTSESRPVSVSERSMMFENISSPPANSLTATSSLPRPAKPPPMRQRSQTDETKSDSVKPDSPGVNRPPRPPFRQRSLFDTKKSSKSDNSSVTDNQSESDKVRKKTPLAPPSKPPRTGAHDDYVKVKLEKEAVDNRVKLTEEGTDTFTDSPSTNFNAHLQAGKTQRSKSDVDTGNTNNSCESSNKPARRPLRPPPPRAKPRPFSIAVDNTADFLRSQSIGCSASDDSDFDDCSDLRRNSDSEFQNDMSKSYDLGDPIKHWDLPRASHPEPTTMRRSLSAECIQKATDNDGNVLYMDPDVLGLHDKSRAGYDIYVDTAGYAVPNRLVKRNKAGHTEQPEAGRAIGDMFKSKIRRFKNLFSEQDKPSPATKPPSIDNRSSAKVRLDVIREKVNQAFEVLQSSIRHKQEPVDDDSQAERLSNDSDSRVDEHEIRKRVEYSRSVKLKTNQSIRISRKNQHKIYPQLFEHAMIVGLQQNTETGAYEPHVIYKFPEIKESNVSVPLFCFPDAANFKPGSSSSKSQSYNFVLTNFDGGRVYGYCRRFVPRKSAVKVPEVICIISPVDAFTMYNDLLESIEAKRQENLDAAQELIAAAFGRPLPSPGQSEMIRTLDKDGDMETIFLTREADNRLDNANVECLLSSLGSDKMLKVFATVLLERSVLFCAKQLSSLSSIIHAIVSLLYPFSWQHTFIPVLPSDMLDVVCSPTPYIIGITASLVPKAMDLPLDENVLVFDIDKRSFIRSQGDESTLLPKKIEKALKTSLNMCRIDPDAKSNPNLMISETFLRFFVEAVGHYGQYIVTQQDGTKNFEKQEFVKGVNSGTLQQLLEWLVETQMFEVFMTKQLEKSHNWGNTIELFESRIQEKFTGTGGKKFRRKLGKKFDK